MISIYKDNIFLIKSKLCNNFFSKGLGLMFTFNPQSALLVNNSESIISSNIHMFFMFYSIDVYWLNKNFEVVNKKLNLKPFTFNHSSKYPAMYILEVPVNSISLDIGDKIEIKR